MYIKRFQGYISKPGEDFINKQFLKSLGPAEYVDDDEYYIEKARDDTFTTETHKSKNWKNWIAERDPDTCAFCLSKHGEIYPLDKKLTEKPPVHPYCRCVIEVIKAVFAGEATNKKEDGADFWVINHGELPDYYITESELSELGWSRGDRPFKYAPGRMFGGEIYENNNGHLPSANGRVWYEADINYYNGVRNRHRLLYSSDGLVFVTYDHYLTFYEIARGKNHVDEL